MTDDRQGNTPEGHSTPEPAHDAGPTDGEMDGGGRPSFRHRHLRNLARGSFPSEGGLGRSAQPKEDRIGEENFIEILDRSNALASEQGIAMLDALRQVAREIVESLNISSRLVGMALRNAAEAPSRSKHQFNVAVYSTKIAMGLNYADTAIEDLCLAALVHDVGELKLGFDTYQKGELSEEERRQLRLHPEYGAEIVLNTDPTAESIAAAVRQEHENIDGSGYPRGLRGKSIHDFAKVIRVADAYDALTHGRTYKDAVSAFGGIREQIRGKGSEFDPLVIKALMNELSLFPVESYVRLNTGEIGRVVEINRMNPLRPVVEILYSSDGTPITPRRIDLAMEPLLHVVNSLTKDSLPKSSDENSREA